MSNLLGPIRQLGIVVDDIEAGMKHWSETMGVGPWFYNSHVPIVDYTYDGQRYEPHNSVALANSGGYAPIAAYERRGKDSRAVSRFDDCRAFERRSAYAALDRLRTSRSTSAPSLRVSARSGHIGT